MIQDEMKGDNSPSADPPEGGGAKERPPRKRAAAAKRAPRNVAAANAASDVGAAAAPEALASDALTQGRGAYARRAWARAYDKLLEADRQQSLDVDDLERLATAARLVNREEESTDLWTRFHHACLEGGARRRAIRSASWLALSLHARGERARGAGWLARSRRLLADETEECVERGYHLMALALQCVGARDIAGAAEAFEHATRIGERFGDRDLVTRAQQGQARTLINTGSPAAGGALLDEVLVAVTASEVSAVAVGDIYCSAIEACYEMFDVRRAREWTDALSRWCEGEPELVLFRGQCQVRRAEVLQLTGEWRDALDEAGRARDAMASPPPDRLLGAAHYRVGELRRLRGDYGGASQAYREAWLAGHSTQPGQSLLRLAQGEIESARATLRRALDEATDKRVRARLLAACIEVTLAADDVESARTDAVELDAIAEALDSHFLRATSCFTMGNVLLAAGDARSALAALRQAWNAWRELEAPWEEGRTRVVIALACRGVGDDESAQMELDAAWALFRRVGAAPDMAHVEQLGGGARQASDDRLTEREQEVMALLATGMTNRALAAELRISEKTVARHVSNIFTKLGVTTRAAATAHALRRPPA